MNYWSLERNTVDGRYAEFTIRLAMAHSTFCHPDKQRCPTASS